MMIIFWRNTKFELVGKLFGSLNKIINKKKDYLITVETTNLSNGLLEIIENL